MPLDIFWSLRTAGFGCGSRNNLLTATTSSESGLMPIGVTSPISVFSLQGLRDSPRQASFRNSSHRDPGIYDNNRRPRKVVTDDISSAPEPTISNDGRFRRLLCRLYYALFIRRSVRCDRMGALPMYHSPRCPYFSISRGNFAFAFRHQFLGRCRSNPPQTRSIAPPPRLRKFSIPPALFDVAFQ